MFQELKSPISSQELQNLLSEIYGNQVTTEMFVNATLENKDARLSLVSVGEQICGYIIWLIEKEVEEDEDSGKKTTTTILAIDEIVTRVCDQTQEIAEEIIKGIEEIVKKVGWVWGSTRASKVKSYQEAGNRIERYRKHDPEGVLQEAEKRRKKKKETK